MKINFVLFIQLFSLITIFGNAQNGLQERSCSYDFYLLNKNKFKLVEMPRGFDRDYYYVSSDSIKMDNKYFKIHAFPVKDGKILPTGIQWYIRSSSDSVFITSDLMRQYGTNESLLFIANCNQLGSKWYSPHFYASASANLTLILKSVEKIDDDIIYCFSVVDYQYRISHAYNILLHSMSYSKQNRCFVRLEYTFIDDVYKKLILVPKGQIPY